LLCGPAAVSSSVDELVQMHANRDAWADEVMVAGTGHPTQPTIGAIGKNTPLPATRPGTLHGSSDVLKSSSIAPTIPFRCSSPSTHLSLLHLRIHRHPLTPRSKRARPVRTFTACTPRTSSARRPTEMTLSFPQLPKAWVAIALHARRRMPCLGGQVTHAGLAGLEEVIHNDHQPNQSHTRTRVQLLSLARL
jgi:hypothetical protein